MRIVVYEAVENSYINLLNETVNTMIKDGWQPLGVMSIGISGKYNIHFCQTMVKYALNDRHVMETVDKRNKVLADNP